jgi:hypothetical protein
MEKYVPCPRFEETKKFMKNGFFGEHDYTKLLESLEGNEGFKKGDWFLVGKDFPFYIECQEKVDKTYRDQEVKSLFHPYNGFVFCFNFVHYNHPKLKVVPPCVSSHVKILVY